VSRPDPLVLGLVGDPVSHSLSPRMHAAAFRALGIAAEYRTVRVPADHPDEVEPALRALASTGGGNVTLPHKQTAAAALDVASEEVRLTGACNCFWEDSRGRLCGDNTDVGGVLGALGELRGFRPRGARVLVLGAGGAARAAVVACARAGAAWVAVRNRDRGRAEALVASLVRDGGAALTVDDGGALDGRLDLVIQATSLGLLVGDPLPLRLDGLDVGSALDLVYAPGGTAWTRHARAVGIDSVDGLRVLLHQGALSLARWLGSPPDAAVVRAMEEALA
jgi:shikimate dehydrogenase